MSETETQEHSASTAPATSAQGFLKDVVLWKRRNLSVVTLLISTITWVLLEAYQLNFVTVASWACMLLISALFLLNNLLRLLGKESATNLWRCDQLTQEWTERVAKSVGEVMEEGIRCMFRVSVDKEWHVFARTVVLLLVFSKVVAFFDLLSLLYTCTLVGMTVPVTYLKYEEKIKRYAEGVKARWRRACEMFDDRVVRKVKNMFIVHANKDNKVE